MTTGDRIYPPSAVTTVSSSSLSSTGGSTTTPTIAQTERGKWLAMPGDNSITPDGCNYVAGSGGILWKRLQGDSEDYGDPRLLTVGAVTIDSSGDNASADHWKDWQEFVYRANPLRFSGGFLAVTLGAGTWTGTPLMLRLARTSVVVVSGTRSNLVGTGTSGTLTLTAWSNAGKVVAKAVNSALASVWPANVLSQFLSLTGHAGIILFAGKDVGSKMIVTPGPYDTVNGAVYAGAGSSEAFQAYSLASVLSNGADTIEVGSRGSGVLSFSDVEFSTSAGGGTQVDSGLVGFTGCRFMGTCVFFPSSLGAVQSLIAIGHVALSACYMQHGSEPRDGELFLDGVFTDGAVKAGARGAAIIKDQCLSASGGWQTDVGGSLVITGSASTHGVATAMFADSSDVRITGYFFPISAATRIIEAKGGCHVRYVSAAQIGAEASGTTPAAAFAAGATTSTTLPCTGTSGSGIVLRS